MTVRAVKVLRDVDLIAAEDTRHSRILLKHFGISKRLVSYWSEKERVRAEEIIAELRSGLSVALISDSGTPGISDPGAVLIRRAIQEGIPLVPLPGPSAVITALSISGLPTEEFLFVGFLPSKTAQRKKKLMELQGEPRTLIFYEAPHRIRETLGDLEEILGDRNAFLAREITKLHETFLRGTLPEMRRAPEHLKTVGEYVVIVEGKKREAMSTAEALEEVRVLMRRGKGRKEAVRIVAEEYGISKNELYDKSLGNN